MNRFLTPVTALLSLGIGGGLGVLCERYVEFCVFARLVLGHFQINHSNLILKTTTKNTEPSLTSED